MFKKICTFCLFSLMIHYVNAEQPGSQAKNYTKNGYKIKYTYCPSCEFLDNDQKTSFDKSNDALQLEYEKSYSDHAQEAEPDKYFLDAISYRVNTNRKWNDPFVFAVLIKRKYLNYAMVVYHTVEGYGQLTCIPPIKHNSKDIKKLLLARECREAIKSLDIPMSISDIKSLTRAKGSLN